LRRCIDLHMHSHCSDGERSPSNLVQFLKSHGAELIALTDHDHIDGIEAAKSEAEKIDIRFLSGVEISTVYRDGEIHVLGYFSDPPNSSLQAFLKKRFRDREHRMAEMIQRLREIGVCIDYQQVLEQSPGPYVCRPNIAKAMVQSGYVMSMDEAFSELYIGNHGKAYVPPYGCSPSEAIREIKKSGGKAFIAHPGIYFSPYYLEGLQEQDFSIWIHDGLDGIEAFHPKHTFEMTKRFCRTKRKLQMAFSVGSDYHYGEYKKFWELVPQQSLEEIWEWFTSAFS